MEIEKIVVHQISLPFSFDFSHSLRTRSSVNNIVVEVIAEGGEVAGYGEGAPRSYVTGETQKGAVESIMSFAREAFFPWDLTDASQVWNLVDKSTKGKGANSAICALESSLLDALGKKEKKSIIDYFPQDFSVNTIYYGGAIPLADRLRVMEICHFIKERKISKLKLKLGNKSEENREALDAIKQVYGGDYDLKVDINGVWDYEMAVAHLPLIKEYNVKVVEQPMKPDDPNIARYARIMQENGLILMADESACCFADIETIAKKGQYGMVNMRLSKCGGFRNSIKLIDYLRDQEISFQIGCQLGESGILSAAGRVLGLLCSDAVYYDGSYDEFLLRENVTLENVSFGLGGEAGPLKGPGLGVEINHESLQRLSNPSTMVTIGKP
jgi:L-alanine-DL-glutamate epimerase-like enolase superfamily enzyme